MLALWTDFDQGNLLTEIDNYNEKHHEQFIGLNVLAGAIDIHRINIGQNLHSNLDFFI